MANYPDSPAAAEQVSCEVCLKEIPSSEARRFETEDYVAYFCGLDCYSKWKHRSEAPAQQDKSSQR